MVLDMEEDWEFGRFSVGYLERELWLFTAEVFSDVLVEDRKYS